LVCLLGWELLFLGVCSSRFWFWEVDFRPFPLSIFFFCWFAVSFLFLGKLAVGFGLQTGPGFPGCKCLRWRSPLVVLCDLLFSFFP